MKKLKTFFLKLYTRIYLHFYNCNGDCDKCIEKHHIVYAMCIHDRVMRRNTPIIRYLKSKEFCEKGYNWATRYKSFEKMFDKMRNAYWLFYVAVVYNVTRQKLALSMLDAIDTFIPYASEYNQRILIQVYTVLRKHGIYSKEMADLIDPIKEVFEMHVEGEDDIDKFNMYISSSIKSAAIGHSVIPGIIIIASECPYGKWTLEKTYAMICQCMKVRIKDELLENVHEDYQRYLHRKLFSTES